MQLYPITRKSATMALLLLAVILISATLRYTFSPFEIELADNPYRERAVSLLMAMLLMLIGGVLEGRMFPRSGLNKGYCTLPMPIYGVLSCGIFFAPDALATSSMSVCLVLALFLLLRSLHSAGEKDSVFFASILLGAMVLLNPLCIVLVGVIPLSIFILALSLRQTLLMVVGYALPFAAASYAMWYSGGELLDFGRNMVESLARTQMLSVEQTPYVAVMMAIYVVALLIWGVVYAVVRSDKMFQLARVKRALGLFVGVFFLSLSMFFLPSANLSILALLAVPTTILLSFVLSILPTNHSTIAYWVLLLIFVLHLFVG